MSHATTVIVTSANVDTARAAQSGATFPCKLSATGLLPATHYASSGFISEAAVAALDGLCAITTGDHDPHGVIAAAGLILIEPTEAP